jgi:hypothetical protein
VAVGVVVEVLLGKADEAVHRARRQCAVEGDRYLARRARERHLDSAVRGHRPCFGRRYVLGRLLSAGRVLAVHRIRQRLRPLLLCDAFAGDVHGGLVRCCRLLIVLCGSRIAVITPDHEEDQQTRHEEHGDDGRDHSDAPLPLRSRGALLQLPFQLALGGFATLLIGRHRPSLALM